MSTESAAQYVGRYRETFTTPFDQLADRRGERFDVLRVIDSPDAEHDEEVLPMFRIRFGDGREIDAWPEEVLEPENAS